MIAVCTLYSVSAADTPNAKLAFKEDGTGNLVFNTGIIKGSMQKDGQGGTLKPISFIEPNLQIDRNHGLLVPYRFLTPQKRYGFGSWEWPRTGKVLNDGSAELSWASSGDRPFSFGVLYKWKSVDTLDATITFTPDTNLDKFELFLGSYFANFSKAKAYVKDAGNGKAGFVEAAKDKGGMQLFPASDEVMPMIKDGRWTYPPYPNNWSFRQAIAAPLGMRQEPKSGATVVIMASPDDCFAVSMSQQEANLGAFYVSLFGKDVKKGQTLTGHVRLVFGLNISDEQAVQKYNEYVKDLK